MCSSIQACVAAQMLADRYPQGGKVRVIDSLGASSGFGLLLEYAADVRDSGASLDETAAYPYVPEIPDDNVRCSTSLPSATNGSQNSSYSPTLT